MLTACFVVVIPQLWALLHFIMPTLFDSHDEFNEWFSRDIESHAENKSAIDESELAFPSHLIVIRGIGSIYPSLVRLSHSSPLI